MKNMKFAIVFAVTACLLFSSGAVFAQTEEELCLPKFRHNMFSVDMVNAREGWACGGYGLIYHTEDGGISWQIQPTDTKEEFFSVSFVNSKVGWVCGNKGIIFKTTDGGKSWKRQKSPKNKMLFVIRALSPDKAIAGGDWGTIVATTDGGKTWEDWTYPKDMQIYGMDFVDENEGWIAGEFGTILHTTDGGRTWEKQETGLPEGGMLYSVSFLNNQIGVVSGIDGMILRTTDGGVLWQEVEYMTAAEIAAKKAFIEAADTVMEDDAREGKVAERFIKEQTARRPLFVIEILGDIAIAAGDAGFMVLSGDGGTTWKTVELPPDMRLLWLSGIALTKKEDTVTGVTIGAKSVCIVSENTDFYAVGYLPNVALCEPTKAK